MEDDRAQQEGAGDMERDLSDAEPRADKAPLAAFVSPAQLCVITLVTLVLGEASVMLLLSIMPPLNTQIEAVVDGILLAILACPFLYILVYRPMRTHIEQRKLSEARKDRLISRLAQAREEIIALQGIIPICAKCKTIRNDPEAMEAVERYIREFAGVRLPLGVCPRCVKMLHPQRVSDDSEKGA